MKPAKLTDSNVIYHFQGQALPALIFDVQSDTQITLLFFFKNQATLAVGVEQGTGNGQWSWPEK